MTRDWNDFKAINGTISGAREAFENACESLFRKIHPDKHVSQVMVNVGDGGIDIFIGELGIEPITVIQCKFFLDSFNDSQKSQIRNSFKTAVNSDKYELKGWILCIPRIIDIDENSWWFKWKNKSIMEHSSDVDFIKLINGNELIDLFKEYHLYNSVFKIDDSIMISEIHQAIVPKMKNRTLSHDAKLVLFNNYSQRCEPYYYERDVDRNFIKSLRINNIWVFGCSGAGKTVLINRNLTKNEFEYIFCDLSPISINNSEQVLDEIVCKIEERFNVERAKEVDNKIKQITQILCLCNKKEVIVVVDELSVNDNSVLKCIASDLMSLVVHYNNTKKDSSLKFVVSTISSPHEIINNYSKASEHFQYIDCAQWEDNIDDFFEFMTAHLGLDLNNYKEMILSAIDNSPRILKSMLRKIVILDKLSPESIEKAIRLTLSEFVR